MQEIIIEIMNNFGYIGIMFLIEPIYSVLEYIYESIEFSMLKDYLDNIIQNISEIIFIIGAEFGLIGSKKKYKEIGVILILISIALFAINPYLTELICK